MITLEVKFSAGISIEDASHEAFVFGQKLGANIEFRFNDIICLMPLGGSIPSLVENYWKAWDQNERFAYGWQ